MVDGDISVGDHTLTCSEGKNLEGSIMATCSDGTLFSKMDPWCSEGKCDEDDKFFSLVSRQSRLSLHSIRLISVLESGCSQILPKFEMMSVL